MRGFLLRPVWALVVLAVCAGAGFWYYRATAPAEHYFRTVPVKRGELVSYISATGTVEPEEVVDVGAQVAGQILNFGKDKNGKTVDYGSEVEEGTILAQIDESLYQAALATAETQIEVDKASVLNAKANLDVFKAKLSQARSDLQQLQAAIENAQGALAQYKAKLDQASADWIRAQQVGPSGAISQESFDSFKATFEMAKANMISGTAAVAQAKANAGSGQAVIEQAQAGVESGEAMLKQAGANLAHDQAASKTTRLNLEYCTIKAPVKGTIIDRRVNIGQTVVASLSTPSLFLIGKDLTRMQIWAPVNEADIGNIHAGQTVTFTIDAFPGQTFTGSVNKVRLNATMTQNVVTYTVEVVVDNTSGKLLPYLTANAKFEIARKKDVLTVPNAALRWTPDPALVAPDVAAQEKTRQGRHSGKGHSNEAQVGEASRQNDNEKPAAAEDGSHQAHGRLWVLDGLFVRPLHVRVGITDGTNTEVSSEELQEGVAVITSESAARLAGDSENKNPFAPQPLWRRPTPARPAQ